MTTGDKISKLRKENNLTQEQLADMLGVSRQSVSKYESNLAYPETEKIIKLSEIFHCSTDYLLREDIEYCKPIEEVSDEAKADISAEAMLKALWSFDKKSKHVVAGLPLWHIGKNAKGIFAIGLKAQGIVAIGLLSVGVVSFGFLSVGILAFGLLALGVLAAGTFALGGFALGSIACGIFAAGAIAIGEFAAGALAIGHYMAIGDHAEAMFAFGITAAEGNIYQHLQQEGPIDKAMLLVQVEEAVPKIYQWLAKLMMNFL